MELADILADRAVLCCTDVRTKSQLFSALAERAALITGRPAGDIEQSITSREDLGSTALGNGIAIPHGKVPGLKAVTAVFARLDQPIEFDAVDDQPVDLVVMLLAPVGAGADHLRALSLVARQLRTETVVEALRRHTNPAQLRDVLTGGGPSHFAA